MSPSITFLEKFGDLKRRTSSSVISFRSDHEFLYVLTECIYFISLLFVLLVHFCLSQTKQLQCRE